MQGSGWLEPEASCTRERCNFATHFPKQLCCTRTHAPDGESTAGELAAAVDVDGGEEASVEGGVGDLVRI